MSNVVSGNPLKIDTATLSYAAIGLPNTLTLDIRLIYWESPAAAADKIQFANTDGLVLFEATAEVAPSNAGNSLAFYFQPRTLLFTKAQGWYPKTIASGVVWVYFVYA